VREANNGNKYLTLTESKRLEKDKFDRSRIFIFKNKIEEFMGALQEAYQVAA